MLAAQLSSQEGKALMRMSVALQKAQRSGSDYKVVSNWNGTIELPTYEFGDKVLQEGSFGEQPSFWFAS